VLLFIYRSQPLSFNTYINTKNNKKIFIEMTCSNMKVVIDPLSEWSLNWSTADNAQHKRKTLLDPRRQPGLSLGASDTHHSFFLFYLVCEAIGTAATPGLLCQPRVIMKMILEKQMECRLAGETEVLEENLPQRHFCPSQNPTWPYPGLNPGRRGGKPATNRLSYGAAPHHSYIFRNNRFASVVLITSFIV
jgi:hypothetical protein